ncbi:MAG: ATP phosphoribosyltransferase, partial [Thermoproteus sp.]|nr:ATP phosphoribosyltransferase [Thermoproteus sp.]
PEDIPAIVSTGRIAAGITGHDYVVESGADVVEALDLGIGAGTIVVAAPRGKGWRGAEDVPDGAKIATKYANIVRRFFEDLGKRVKIIQVSGSVEVLPMLGIADAVADVMATGTTLALHGLEPIAEVLRTTARLVVNKDSEREYTVRKLVVHLEALLKAQNKKMIFLNVPADKISEVVSVLPAMESPSVARLARGDMYEVFSVVDEAQLPDLVMKLREAGAKDVVVVPVEMLMRL